MRLLFGNPRDAHLGEDLLSGYLDGQVSAAECRRLDLHLATCAACRSELEGLRRTVAMLQAMPRAPMPRAFTLSEAQAGIRRPVEHSAWFGGVLRGFAAVTAVALVAVTAATLMRQPTWEPSAIVARVAAPATAAVVAEARPSVADKLPAAAAPVVAPVPQSPPSEKPPAPITAPAVAKEVAPTSAPVALAPKAALPTSSVIIAPTATAAPQPAAQPSPEKPVALAAAALPTPTLTTAPQATASDKTRPAAAAAGRGSGGESQTAAGAALPSDVALAYVEGRTLWAVDRAAGTRPLVSADGIAAPVISSDRSRVAYRLAKPDGNEVWEVAWAGGAPKLLLAERDLNAALPSGYQARAIQEMQWLADKPMLLLTTLATGTGSAARLEMWRLDRATGEHVLLAHSDAGHQPVASPDGLQAAFFRREPEKAVEGGLWIAPTLASERGAGVAGNAQVVLRFPARADQRSYAGQIAWLPDSAAFWAAIPDTVLDGPQPINGLTLYRVPVKGVAQSVAHLDARETFWTADGARLAYTRLTGPTGGDQELFLAGANGAAPQLYTSLQTGRFLDWSPDGARFLYEEGGQLYLAAPGQRAVRVGEGAAAARWLAAEQILYLTTGAGGRQWLTQTMDGKITPLPFIPAEATVAISRP